VIELATSAERYATVLTLPFHRRHLRRSVWVMLLAWSLALMAGVANACRLQSHGLRAPVAVAAIHGDSAEPALHPARTLPVEYSPHDGLSEHHGSTTEAAKAGCLKFCDDESSAVARSTTAQTDSPGPFMVANVEWRSAVPTGTVTIWRSVERPASRGPPLVIRFLRLTI